MFSKNIYISDFKIRFIDCPIEWICEVYIIGNKYMQYDRKRSSSREGCELKDSTLCYSYSCTVRLYGTRRPSRRETGWRVFIYDLAQ
ncbi:hypothetical protein ALC62_09511 [Cyphomyrmex costatus]|uniref:Uncharacterized protein n=1 Tax=Cyphomyrmex costatus TaxID=456900 RepID=A0A195CGN3_9HYME|nr:hypothetical protein ALC62_09511 [Cyphomyrmex costatus]